MPTAMTDSNGPWEDEWPEVVLGGGRKPRPIEHELVKGVRPAAPRKVIAYGTVQGIPWLLQEVRTEPEGEWWDVLRPVGTEFEFFLGNKGEHGQGRIATHVPTGHHCTATGICFAGLPDIVVWVGVVSPQCDHVETRLGHGRSRRLDLYPDPSGSLRFFFVFVPQRARTEIEVFGVAGETLELETLPRIGLAGGASHISTVNPFGSPEGSPPPGWPEEARTFPPGEGARWAEDFYLHVAPFPLFVFPPGGSLSAGGVVRASRPWNIDLGYEITDIAFAYLNHSGHRSQVLELVNSSPGEADRRANAWEEFPWWFGQRLHEGENLHFKHGFLLDLSILGPQEARYLGGAQAYLEGSWHPIELWSFPEEPNLFLTRVRLPGVWISIRGSDVEATFLLGLVRRLMRLELGSELFKQMKRAGFRS